MKTMKGFQEQGIEIAIGILFVGIVAGLAGVTMSSIWTQQGGISIENETRSKAIQNITAGVLNFSSQLPTVGLVGGIAIVLLILFGAVGVFMTKK